jgi:hypothetical protein
LRNCFQKASAAEVAALFRRALDGELVERIPLRHHTPDGRVLELELSLSRRQKAGVPLAVRCLMRDVTQQKQRENRLALQLAVSQIVGENTASESAGMRILEALCLSQGWDVSIEWVVAPNRNISSLVPRGERRGEAEALIQGSMGLRWPAQASCPSAPGKRGGRCGSPTSPKRRRARVSAAIKQDMMSGWAVPVRAGNKVLAVLEFYCRFRLREDREAMAAWKPRPPRWANCWRAPRNVDAQTN